MLYLPMRLQPQETLDHHRVLMDHAVSHRHVIGAPLHVIA